MIEYQSCELEWICHGRRGSDGFAGQSAGGTFGNDEASAGGAADSLLCIKKEDASYKRYEN